MLPRNSLFYQKQQKQQQRCVAHSRYGHKQSTIYLVLALPFLVFFFSFQISPIFFTSRHSFFSSPSFIPIPIYHHLRLSPTNVLQQKQQGATNHNNLTILQRPFDNNPWRRRRIGLEGLSLLWDKIRGSESDEEEGLIKRWRRKWKLRIKDHVVRAGCGSDWLKRAVSGDNVRVRYVVMDGLDDRILDKMDGLGYDGVIGGGGGGELWLRVGVSGGDVGSGLIGVCRDGLREFWMYWKSLGRRVRVFVYVEEVVGNGEEDENSGELGQEEKWEGKIVGVGGRKGWSCERVCRDWGGVCEEGGFIVMNGCSRLRQVFQCKVCEVAAVGSAGPDMPCWVHWSAPTGHPRGYCLVHPHKGKSRCEAMYRHTLRLCPCAKKDDAGQ